VSAGTRQMWQSRGVETWAITGGSGFLGVHLARRLLAEGAAARSLDVAPCDEPGVESIGGDIRNPAAASTLCRGADVLVHAAAALPIRRADVRAVNVEGTATVLAAAAGAGVRRVVFISSGVVYGLPPHPPAIEDTQPAPIEPYGVSKVEAESVCRAFGARGLEVVVLRPQPFVGPGRLGVFGILFDWIREGRRIYTIGPGTTRYQFLSVEDLVEAIILAARKPVPGETFNVGAAEFGTVADDLQTLIAHAGSRSRVTPVPAGPVRVLLRALDLARLSPLSAWHYRSGGRDCFIDVSKAERLLGWRPRHSNREALVAAYDSYVRSRDAWAAPGTTHRAPWNQRALGIVRRLS